ncbi:fuconate dehydratase [Candidatus Binatia bacterium]|jgi:L-fuconate dehydratase|nr:fuconate dehydratase [Candidatus Binatia bacterium]
MKIRSIDTYDVRFPTSRTLAGSDAMHPDPDYSAAYAVVRVDDAGAPSGHGLAFTIGRGNEIVVAAIEALAPLVVGRDLDAIFADMGAFSRSVTQDGQLRWIGPEKGAIHMAAAAILNALWDLRAKLEGQPLWRLLASMTPEQIVSLIDFRYLTDALTPAEALAILRERAPGRAARVDRLSRDGLAAYVTSAGWMGYSDETVIAKCADALGRGFTRFKMKVGGPAELDVARARLVRSQIGNERILMMDANQIWDVPEAIERMRMLAKFDPYWIEEPTSPDDVLGHQTIARAIAPIRVATGEMAQNRVIFKQLLQAGAIGAVQIDACRLGGVNEVLAVLLLAAKFDVPVCPHAGGVGLCEYVQHLAAFDQIAVAPALDGRYVEFADHLHEHFVNPVVVENGAYRLPTAPGYGVELKPASIEAHLFPGGAVWR